MKCIFVKSLGFPSATGGVGNTRVPQGENCAESGDLEQMVGSISGSWFCWAEGTRESGGKVAEQLGQTWNSQVE